MQSLGLSFTSLSPRSTAIRNEKALPCCFPGNSRRFARSSAKDHSSGEAVKGISFPVRKPRGSSTLFACVLLLVCFQESQANSQDKTAAPEVSTSLSEPMVSRVELRLTLSEKELDVIEKGDLVTVLEERETSFLIRTYRGVKGAVEKANVVKLAESVEVYDDLIRENPKLGRLYTLRAGAQWARRDGDAALKDFDQAIELGYDSANAYSSRALFLTASGQYDKAVEDFNKAVEKGDRSESILINRAAAYLQMNKVDEAIADYSAAIALNDKNAGIFQQRATAYKVKGDLGKAAEDFGKAIQVSPTFIPAIMGRGYVYFQAGDHAKAVEDFSSVIKLNDRASVAYNNRGYNYQLLGKNQEALRDFDKSIDLTPQYALAFQNRAWLLATCEDESLRDPKKAILSATKACELNEYSDLSDMAALAAAHAAAKEFDLAIGIQEKIVERAPEPQKVLAKQLLELYRQEKPFDPKLSSASLDASKDTSKGDTNKDNSEGKEPAK
jgi:tetratricopeptide (TPR) repeat protein